MPFILEDHEHEALRASIEALAQAANEFDAHKARDLANQVKAQFDAIAPVEFHEVGEPAEGDQVEGVSLVEAPASDEPAAEPQRAEEATE